MSNQIKYGHFEADGSDINLPLGFVPHKFKLTDMIDTNPDVFEWQRLMEQDMASGKQEGIMHNGDDGVLSYLGDGAGITAYDAGSQVPSIAEWTETLANASTAKTSTARGTLFKASVGALNEDGDITDRSAIFEVVTTDGGGGSTEPVWPAILGGQIDTNGIIFEKVDAQEALGRAGYQGVAIAAALMTNGREYFFEAVLGDTEEDLGDVDSWPSGVQGG